MLLAIDVRNRGASFGFRDAGSWSAICRVGVSPERSAWEYSLYLESAWERARKAVAASETPAGRVDRAWISSVVPALTPRFAEAALSAFGVEAEIVGPGVRTGVKIRTDHPSEVGSDLVCGAAAARELVGTPCLVVSFGTVLAVSAVDAEGDFVGAAFAPGLLAAAECLRGSAAQIPEVPLDAPGRAIGRNTVQSVQSGLVLGYGGLVARLVGSMSAELDRGSGVHVVGTGAEEGRALLASEGWTGFIPDLVLEGLAIIAGRQPRA
jgi:type III pantothenate kinase